MWTHVVTRFYTRTLQLASLSIYGNPKESNLYFDPVLITIKCQRWCGDLPPSLKVLELHPEKDRIGHPGNAFLWRAKFRSGCRRACLMRVAGCFPSLQAATFRPSNWKRLSCLFHAESGKKKTAGSFILSPNGTKHEQDVLWLHPGSSLTGERFKNPNPLQECGLFLSPGLGSGPLGARRGGSFKSRLWILHPATTLMPDVAFMSSGDSVTAACLLFLWLYVKALKSGGRLKHPSYLYFTVVKFNDKNKQ